MHVKLWVKYSWFGISHFLTFGSTEWAFLSILETHLSWIPRYNNCVYFKFLSSWSFVKSTQMWDLINIFSSTYLDSWSNESSQRNLAEKLAKFAGCRLLYTTLHFEQTEMMILSTMNFVNSPQSSIVTLQYSSVQAKLAGLSISCRENINRYHYNKLFCNEQIVQMYLIL